MRKLGPTSPCDPHHSPTISPSVKMMDKIGTQWSTTASGTSSPTPMKKEAILEAVMSKPQSCRDGQAGRFS